VPLTYNEDEDRADLVAFADVIHDLDAAGGCAAALLVVNQQSEPIEFVFNRARPGCRHLPLGRLWGSTQASRAEAKLLLRSLFDECGTSPSVLVVDEDTVDGRLVALDLRIAIPTGLLRAGSSGVVRWLPARPPEQAEQAVGALIERTTLEEILGRVRSGLEEALRSPGDT
jgi:hypothetical protein